VNKRHAKMLTAVTWLFFSLPSV